MRRLKESLKIILVVFMVISLLLGVGYIKYKIWRLEHPQAKTWVFFISSGKR